MLHLKIADYLFIKNVQGKGRGVFTKQDINAKTIVERAPVIVLSAEDRELVEKTKLYYYIFEWGALQNECAVALGWVSIYNHSYNCNCDYFMDYDAQAMWVQARRKIKAGEELTINYNGDWDKKDKLWFDVVE